MRPKEIFEDIGMFIGIGIVAIGGFLLILICQPFFWLAVIAITLVVYLT